MGPPLSWDMTGQPVSSQCPPTWLQVYILPTYSINIHSSVGHGCGVVVWPSSCSCNTGGRERISHYSNYIHTVHDYIHDYNYTYIHTYIREYHTITKYGST